MIPSFKKMACYWHKMKHIDQLNRMNDPDVSLQTYKDAKNTQ